MGFRHFFIPFEQGAEAGERELNAFLSQAVILGVDHVVTERGRSYAVEFASRGSVETGGSTNGNRSNKGRPKVDWREKLTAEEFAIFDRLRKVRTSIFEETGIPRYGIFTDDHLGAMIQQQCKTEADLRKIDGIGKGRVESYGARILEVLTN